MMRPFSIPIPQGALPMAVLAITAGDWALIILAAAWAALVLFLCVVLLNTYNVLTSTRLLIDSIRQETVPLLSEVRNSVSKTNREIDRVDGMLERADNIVGRVERISTLVERAVTSPLVKVVGVGAGLRSAAARFRRGPSSPTS
jgi:uncharacterized protein YoxC